MTKKPSAKTKSLIAKGREYYTAAYKPRETILARGAGAKVWDLDGNDYIDLGAGIAVSALGYHNKDMLNALNQQIGRASCRERV